MAPVLIDPVTGLFDRRRFVALAEQEARRAVRYGRPMTLIALALEGLPQEDAAPERDAALRRAAALVSDAIREHDLLAHLGNGVFAVLLIETGEAGAQVVARRLAERIGAAPAGSIGFAAGPVRIATAACCLEVEPVELSLQRILAQLDGTPWEGSVDHHLEPD